VAIATKTALTALKGEVMPQFVSVPIPLVEHPDFKAGVNFFPELTDNFFNSNDFPPCGVNILATDIMGKSETDN
jgi:ribose transport system substrate-binding protein